MTFIKFEKDMEFNKEGDIVDVIEDQAKEYIKKKIASEYVFPVAEPPAPAPEPTIVDAEIVG